MYSFHTEITNKRNRILFTMACLMSLGAIIGFVGSIIIQNDLTKTLFILSSFSMIFHWVLYFLFSQLNKLNFTDMHIFTVLIYLIFTIIAMYNPFDFHYMWAYLLYFPIIIGLIENEKVYKFWSVLYIILYLIFLIQNNHSITENLMIIVQLLLAVGSIIVGSIMVKYVSFVRQLYDQSNEKQIKEHVFEVLSTLIPIVESKTHSTKNEILEMAELMKEMTKRLPKVDIKSWEIDLLSMLHFVSRIEWPDYLFDKQEPLTEYEFKIVQHHSFLGCKLLRNFQTFENIKEAFFKHHQHKDGSGYPYETFGDNIPKLAQILGLVESYIALIYPRAYHVPMTQEEALLEIQKFEQPRFDPDVLDALLDVVNSKLNVNRDVSGAG
jgi:HD-GYP domain-containing protein (c-di-GMP phosphodiesterase class II)